MNVEEALPENLRGPDTNVTKIAAGLSGAGVYRVDRASNAYVLKLAGPNENEAEWRSALEIQKLAAHAGLSPRILHVDETRRAVLTDFVADRSFMKLYRDPSTHAWALNQLAQTVRRIHALPIPPRTPARDPREFLTKIWAGLQHGFAVPGFAREAIDRVLNETPPPNERAAVLSHADLNPTNLIYDGQNILLLDWAAAGPMDPLYDLGVLAVFLRMDEQTSLRLLSHYDGAEHSTLPQRFRYVRRLVAALAGAMQLHLAKLMKHSGATGAETVESTPPLGDFYGLLQRGAVKMGTPDGQWGFGLSLLKESLAL